jgi:hypothetical protein
MFSLSPRLPGDISGVARWLFLGIFVLLVSGLVYELIAVGQGVNSGGWLISAVYAVVLAAIALTAFWGFLGLAPGAVQCDWGPGGFTLRYRSGRVVSYRWSDRDLSLVLLETTLPSGIVYTLKPKHPLFSWPWLNPLPEELYREMQTMARARKLVTATRVSRSGTFAEVSTTIRAAQG